MEKPSWNFIHSYLDISQICPFSLPMRLAVGVFWCVIAVVFVNSYSSSVISYLTDLSRYSTRSKIWQRQSWNLNCPIEIYFNRFCSILSIFFSTKESKRDSWRFLESTSHQSWAWSGSYNLCFRLLHQALLQNLLTLFGLIRKTLLSNSVNESVLPAFGFPLCKKLTCKNCTSVFLPNVIIWAARNNSENDDLQRL